MYYLISLIEKGAVNRKVLFGRLEQQNRDNLFVNSLAMELMASQAADDIAPLLLNKIKSYTDAGFAIFSVYDPLQKCMLVKHIDAEDSIIKTIEKVVEEDMLKVRIPVDDATRQMMLNEKIGISQSFADITFGAVSSTDNTAIKCQTGLNTFIGIVHEVSNQLYATTLIGLRQKYDLPSIATLKSYSYVASLTLKRNITELALQESESKLKCLIADKDRYMQIISHDLRSPFQSLMGFSEILVNSLNDCSSEEIRDGLLIINQTSQNTYNLFEDLLLWSKAQSGKLILEHGSVLLKELCDSIIEVLRFNAEQKGLTIVNKVPELFRIWADSNVLKTVLRNLISNAIKFSNHDSDVLVTAEVADGSVIVGISDWGVGISVERQQNIWDDNQLTTTFGTGNEQGTGTGLLLCKELIEKHGGKIWVESRINNGSTFKISIPNLT
ncbi:MULTISPECIES: sensor histidine kinase [unclassified Carboxylicivirga]|uniref:sensor histidine kinase n=1 Tax=Carboxylicivirga TaxID=1628153 RepID=UPI003D336111